jgi:hypothetical protein
MASSINASTSGAGGVITTADNTGILNLQTASTTAVTVDASQNVGIGTTSPQSKLEATVSNGTHRLGVNGSDTNYNIRANGGSNCSITWTENGQADRWTVGCVTGQGYLAFRYNTANMSSGTEAMRIDSSGSFTMGSGGSSVNTGYIYVNGSTGTGYGPRILGQKDGSSKWVIGCQSVIVNDTSDSLMCRAGASGGVVLAATATSWSAYSDERMKDIIEPIDNAIEKVSSLRSVIGKYKDDEEGTRRSFLIAQDVQAVLPEAVDANDTEKLGVRYTEVIPLLVAAIKEQTQIINDLKARIETLEAK